MKLALALVLALLIGAACRYFEIPVPAPPRLQGALLILAITLGYMAVDRALDRRGQALDNRASTTAQQDGP